MSSIPIYFGDAFTTDGNAPFTGNPGAICILEYDDDISDETKQKIANELNLNATAFVSLDWTKSEVSHGEELETENYDTPIQLNSNPDIVKRKIRWFSPIREVPLCGHDTIIAAKLLPEMLIEQDPKLKGKKVISVEFDSKFRGVLGATYNCETGRVSLNFPLSPCLPIYTKGVTWEEQLIDALLPSNSTSVSVQNIQYSLSANMLLVRLVDSVEPSDLREISPDFGKLKLIEIFPGMLGVILTLKGSGGDSAKGKPHFYSRYFAPWVGFNEDPVCGSAHTVLAPYWANELKSGFGETLLGEHLSSRGGLVYCTMVDSERVVLGGEAKILIKGELSL